MSFSLFVSVRITTFFWLSGSYTRVEVCLHMTCATCTNFFFVMLEFEFMLGLKAWFCFVLCKLHVLKFEHLFQRE